MYYIKKGEKQRRSGGKKCIKNLSFNKPAGNVKKQSKPRELTFLCFLVLTHLLRILCAAATFYKNYVNANTR